MLPRYLNHNKLYNYLFQVPEVPLATCQDQLNVDSTHICAGAELGKDACSGDSGGGLFIEDNSNTWHLLGIVSYRARDCVNGTPGSTPGSAPSLTGSMPPGRPWSREIVKPSPRRNSPVQTIPKVPKRGIWTKTDTKIISIISILYLLYYISKFV